jgi:ribokinase
VLIAVLGDCTLDVTVSPTGPMSPGRDVRAHVSLSPGGQASNVAVRLARRGIEVRLIAPIADDTGGQMLAAYLIDESVEARRLPAQHTAVVVAVLEPGGERSMLSDRVPLDGEIAAALRGADWVHCSGYALRDRTEADRVIAALRASDTPRISVGGGSFEDTADAAAAREAIDALGVRLVVVDRHEAGLLARQPTSTAAEAAAALASADRLAVVTDAGRGAAAAGLALDGVVTTDPQGSAAVRDATGAGDAFTAVMLARLAPAWPPAADLIRTALEEAGANGAATTRVVGAQGRIDGEDEPPVGTIDRGSAG